MKGGCQGMHLPRVHMAPPRDPAQDLGRGPQLRVWASGPDMLGIESDLHLFPVCDLGPPLFPFL